MRVCILLFHSRHRMAFCCADVGDGQIEVVGLENSIHVAQITAGMQSGRRLAQCSNVVIR